MCGIITSISKEPTLDNVSKVKLQYEEQKNRGQLGYGFVAIDKNGEVIHSRSTDERNILAELDKLPETNLVMFHHRIPTCNLNAVKANHPIFISNKKNLDYKYFIVHNGSISNTDSLRTEHEEEGFKYGTDVSWHGTYNKELSFNDHTDTESLGIEMAKFVEDRSSRIKARGGAAIFMLQIDRKNKPINFYYFRETNPIKAYWNKDTFFLASEAPGVVIPERKIFKLNLETYELTQRDARLSSYTEIGTKDDLVISPWERVGTKHSTKVEDVKKNTHVTIVKTNEPEEYMRESIKTTERSNTILIDAPDRLLGSIKKLTGSPMTSSLRTIKEMEEIKASALGQLEIVESDIFQFEYQHGEEVITEEKMELIEDQEKWQALIQWVEDQLEFSQAICQ